MTLKRTSWWTSALLLFASLACAGLSGGCGGGAPPTGTQVKVDEKEQEDLQGRMKEFMASKKQGGKKAAKKSP